MRLVSYLCFHNYLSITSLNQLLICHGGHLCIKHSILLSMTYSHSLSQCQLLTELPVSVMTPYFSFTSTKDGESDLTIIYYFFIIVTIKVINLILYASCFVREFFFFFLYRYFDFFCHGKKLDSASIFRLYPVDQSRRDDAVSMDETPTSYELHDKKND